MKDFSTNDSDLLSIIIPCYNDNKTVTGSVDSARRQTYSNKEIIVVDDGSDLRTKRVLAKLNSSVNLLLNEENMGPSVARNKGILESHGKYILVLDADDYFEPDFARKAIDILKSNSDCKLVTCFGRWFGADKKSIIHQPAGGGICEFMYRSAAFGSTLFRKKDWESVGGYDEEMKIGFEDWEFYIRLHKNGGKTYVIPEILFHYRKTKNSRNAIANTKKYKIWEYIYLKHKDLYIQDYERIIGKFTYLLQQQENEKERIRNKLEFRIGYYLLFPLRMIKRFLSL